MPVRGVPVASTDPAETVMESGDPAVKFAVTRGKSSAANTPSM